MRALVRACVKTNRKSRRVHWALAAVAAAADEQRWETSPKLVDANNSQHANTHTYLLICQLLRLLLLLLLLMFRTAAAAAQRCRHRMRYVLLMAVLGRARRCRPLGRRCRRSVAVHARMLVDLPLVFHLGDRSGR